MTCKADQNDIMNLPAKALEDRGPGQIAFWPVNPFLREGLNWIRNRKARLDQTSGETSFAAKDLEASTLRTVGSGS